VDKTRLFTKSAATSISTQTSRVWSPWNGVPAWFAWGIRARIAPVRRNGTPALIADDGRQSSAQNAGYYRTLALDNVPARDGQMATSAVPSGVLAVHAALLPHGKYSLRGLRQQCHTLSTRRSSVIWFTAFHERGLGPPTGALLQLLQRSASICGP